MMRWSSPAIVMVLVISGIPLLAETSSGIATDEGEPVEQRRSISLERADPSEVASIAPSIHLPRTNGRLAIDSEAMAGAMKDIRSDMIPSPFASAHFITRGYDEEANDDMWNGSCLDNDDTVSGDLFYPENDPSGTKGDYIDWYKLNLSGVDPSFPGEARNVTIELQLFDCNGTTLFELMCDEPGQNNVDYVDFLELYVYHNDPMWGLCQLGGKRFPYDDGDDTDGWIYDGGHLDPQYGENWTAHFKSVGPSSGRYDPDGNASGLTEVGWYYVGIAFKYYMTPSAEVRPDFGINYTLWISTSLDINNFPKNRNCMEGAPNSMEAASLDLPKTTGRTHSGLNYFDWYRIEGSDPEMDWNISLWVNVTWAFWPYNQDFGVMIDDSWMYIMLVWWSEGEDGVFGTSDDGWTMDYRILYYTVCRMDKDGNPVPYMQRRFTQSGADNMHVNLRHLNDRIDTPADADPILEGKNPRGIFLGLSSKPVRFCQTPGILMEQYADYQVLDEYKLSVSIRETKPNTAPLLSDLIIEKDDPLGVVLEDPYAGNLDTIFAFGVTYTDAEGDPPAQVRIEFDQYTQYHRSIDLLKADELPQGNPLTGLKLRFEIEGRDLGIEPYPHMAHLWAAEDRPSWAPGRSQRSNDLWFNDTIRVVEDDPIYVREGFRTFYEMAEDSDPIGIPLEGFDGMFCDPDNGIMGYHFSNGIDGPWSESLELDFATINTGIYNGFNCALVELKPNKHGTAQVWVRCYDAVSEARSFFHIEVTEVNDPPFVHGIQKGDSIYPVDNYDPRYPVMRMFPECPFEDREFRFRIVADDMDDEGDDTPLKYEYSAFDDWEVRPKVEAYTGCVTLQPTNADSRSDTIDLAITVSDGEGAVVVLRMTFKVINVNDPPSISMSNDVRDSYIQDQMMKVKVSGSDIDKGDSMVFGVNMESMVGSVVPVSNQIREAELVRGVDLDINPSTGDFWFIPSDQDIWSMSDGTMVRQVRIDFEFCATDELGARSTRIISVDFIDRNSPPPSPGMIYYEVLDADPTADGIQGLGIDLWVRPVVDPDGDVLTYRWSFSDGSSAVGLRVHHDFASGGDKIVQVLASDGDSSSNLTRISITLIEPDQQDVEDPLSDRGGKRDILIPLIVFIVTLAIVGTISAVMIYVFVLPRRKMRGFKKAPMPPTEFDSRFR